MLYQTANEPFAVYAPTNVSGSTSNVSIPGTWSSVGQNQQNTWYTPQNLINASNVANLQPLWSVQLGSTYGTPVVANGIVYVVVGAYPSPATIEALNEATGAVVWSLGPNSNPSFRFSTNGGVNVDAGNLFAATIDGQLVSINALTGAVNWQVPYREGIVGNVGSYEGAQATPLVYNNEIILGEAGSDEGARGFLRAFSETDGSLLSTFYTTPPDPITQSNQAAYGNSWGVCSNCSGGDVWNVPAVDPRTGIIYFQTGNPYPDSDSSQRSPNPTYTNLYTNSIIALDTSTWQMVWYYQCVPDDVHDWDRGMPVQLFNTTINGVPTEVVGAGGKDGYYDVLNAATGALAYKVQVGIHSNDNAPPTPQGVIVYPGNDGGINSYSTYDNQTNMIYTMAYNEPENFTLTSNGAERTSVKGVVNNSTIYAIDASTGAVVWSINFTPGRDQTLGGPFTGFGGGVSSSEGIVFTSGGNRTFYALNAATGSVLWKYALPPNSVDLWNWGPASIVDGLMIETLGGATGGVMAFKPAESVQVLTSKVASGSGSVSPSCSGGCSEAVGSSIVVTATPASGWVFSNWAMAGASCMSGSGSNPCAFAMPNNAVTVSASFTSTSTTVTMHVSYSVAGGGSQTAPVFHYVLKGVSRSLTLTNTATTVSVDAGSTWSVTPNPLTGSTSAQRWYSTQSLAGKASATTIVFVFQHQYYLTMKVSSSTAGSVTPSSGWQNAGVTVTIKATAKTGHTFKSWTGSGTGSYTGISATHTITMNAAITETATFT